MAETGARLVEVGTTNRTRLADYERALTERTALLLKVHTSNYRMIGFVSSTPVSQLAALGPPVVVDAGSGLLDESTPWLPARPEWLHDEPGARQCLEAGATLVMFSGDKLLGGPQAGVIVGRRDLVDRCKAHPLAARSAPTRRRLRGCNRSRAAYLDGDVTSIPFWRMATTPLDELRARAEAIARELTSAKVIDTEAVAGAGSLPGLEIPSVGVAMEASGPQRIASRLRLEGVVARVEDGRVVCDLRSVDPIDDERLVAALRAALA